MRLGLREANQQFSKAIRAVKAGEEVVLTERGKPIAVIQPFPAVSGEEEAVQRMVAAGLLRPALIPRPMGPWKPLRIKGGPITKTLREMRDAD
ncbi:MAG: type II toxin-antitoxin system Phd/YefM family antitoxin [bacterium]